MESLLYGIHKTFVGVLLVVDNGFFDALCQVDAMDATDCGQHFALLKPGGKVFTLAVNQLGQVEQKSIGGNVIQPVNGLQVVARTEFGPKGPMAEGLLGERDRKS